MYTDEIIRVPPNKTTTKKPKQTCSNVDKFLKTRKKGRLIIMDVWVIFGIYC